MHFNVKKKLYKRLPGVEGQPGTEALVCNLQCWLEWSTAVLLQPHGEVPHQVEVWITMMSYVTHLYIALILSTVQYTTSFSIQIHPKWSSLQVETTREVDCVITALTNKLSVQNRPKSKCIYLTMPNPRDTMMTNMRARVLLAHDTSSANTIKPDTLYPLLLRLLYSAVNTAFSNIPEKQ